MVVTSAGPHEFSGFETDTHQSDAHADTRSHSDTTHITHCECDTYPTINKGFPELTLKLTF